MRGPAGRPSASNSPVCLTDRYVRTEVVARVRSFLDRGGVYQSDVVPAIAAAMLAESIGR